ncbi:hypothetical protein BDZ85DRAFT_297614 [Elsinoe ampelina]|uniref:F-box domain-containing protein n=1 Tax=Elsinoe ampelina TaxID=302913 RepID=A0A6A6G651_9PEZI|nr:hypothetical protein BDZ85DRAFT_297614 [Elsinoe ampelina]
MSIKHSKLEELPPEVFAYILSYVEQAKSVGALSQTSKSLRTLVDTNGWQVFVAETFPSFSLKSVIGNGGTSDKTTPHPPWREIARSLLTTNRNLDRRAFQAMFIQPSGDIVQLQPETEATVSKDEDDPERLSRHYPGSRLFRSTPGHSPARSDSSTQSETRQSIVTPKQTTKWKLPKGQTMGFTPVIDSYECIIGDKWTDRKEVLAYSAGSELVLRVRQRPHRQNNSTVQALYSSRWATYRPPGAKEGVDDITYVKLLNHIGGSSPYDEQLLVGTAAGSLQYISARISHSPEPFNIVRQVFNTGARPVQSASLSQTSDSTEPSLLATILADLSLCLHPVTDTRDAGTTASKDAVPQVVQPVADQRLADDGIRAWRTSFLNPRLLAVSLGPSLQPIHIYQVRPDGLSDVPVSKFSILDRNNTHGRVTPKSVYPVEPLWDGDGRVFASGGYDGFVRIHDTRSSNPVQLFLDSQEDGPIYSLLPRPNAHIFAGAARHNVCKIFDLRFRGALLQPHPIIDDEDSPDPNPSSLPTTHPDPTSIPIPWKDAPSRRLSPTNLHTLRASPLSTQPPKSSSYNLYIPRQATHRDGPVYSLSSPSPFSPFIYMGLENSVVEIRLDSLTDKYRDEVLTLTSKGDEEDEKREAKRRGRRERGQGVLQLMTSSNKGELNRQAPAGGMERVGGVWVSMGNGRWGGEVEGLDGRWGGTGR